MGSIFASNAAAYEPSPPGFAQYSELFPLGLVSHLKRVHHPFLRHPREKSSSSKLLGSMILDL